MKKYLSIFIVIMFAVLTINQPQAKTHTLYQEQENSVARIAQEEDIEEAVLLHMMEQYVSAIREDFSSNPLRLVNFSFSYTNTKPNLLFSVGKIKWISKNIVEIDAYYLIGFTTTAYTYQLINSNHQWSIRKTTFISVL